MPPKRTTKKKTTRWDIGRRTLKNIRQGKNIRVNKDGFEQFDDYLTGFSSDTDTSLDITLHRSLRSNSKNGKKDPNISVKKNAGNDTHDKSIRMTRDIGRRTLKPIKVGKNIRKNDDGFEVFDDYFTENELSSSTLCLSTVGQQSLVCTDEDSVNNKLEDSHTDKFTLSRNAVNEGEKENIEELEDDSSTPTKSNTQSEQSDSTTIKSDSTLAQSDSTSGPSDDDKPEGNKSHVSISSDSDHNGTATFTVHSHLDEQSQHQLSNSTINLTNKSLRSRNLQCDSSLGNRSIDKNDSVRRSSRLSNQTLNPSNSAVQNKSKCQIGEEEGKESITSNGETICVVNDPTDDCSASVIKTVEDEHLVVDEVYKDAENSKVVNGDFGKDSQCGDSFTEAQVRNEGKSVPENEITRSVDAVNKTAVNGNSVSMVSVNTVAVNGDSANTDPVNNVTVSEDSVNTVAVNGDSVVRDVIDIVEAPHEYSCALKDETETHETTSNKTLLMKSSYYDVSKLSQTLTAMVSYIPGDNVTCEEDEERFTDNDDGVRIVKTNKSLLGIEAGGGTTGTITKNNDTGKQSPTTFKTKKRLSYGGDSVLHNSLNQSERVTRNQKPVLSSVDGSISECTHDQTHNVKDVNHEPAQSLNKSCVRGRSYNKSVVNGDYIHNIETGETSCKSARSIISGNSNLVGQSYSSVSQMQENTSDKSTDETMHKSTRSVIGGNSSLVGQSNSSASHMQENTSYKTTSEPSSKTTRSIIGGNSNLVGQSSASHMQENISNKSNSEASYKSTRSVISGNSSLVGQSNSSVSHMQENISNKSNDEASYKSTRSIIGGKSNLEGQSNSSASHMQENTSDKSIGEPMHKSTRSIIGGNPSLVGQSNSSVSHMQENTSNKSTGTFICGNASLVEQANSVVSNTSKKSYRHSKKLNLAQSRLVPYENSANESNMLTTNCHSVTIADKNTSTSGLPTGSTSRKSKVTKETNTTPLELCETRKRHSDIDIEVVDKLKRLSNEGENIVDLSDDSVINIKARRRTVVIDDHSISNVGTDMSSATGDEVLIHDGLDLDEDDAALPVNIAESTRIDGAINRIPVDTPKSGISFRQRAFTGRGPDSLIKQLHKSQIEKTSPDMQVNIAESTRIDGAINRIPVDTPKSGISFRRRAFTGRRPDSLIKQLHKSQIEKTSPDMQDTHVNDDHKTIDEEPAGQTPIIISSPTTPSSLTSCLVQPGSISSQKRNPRSVTIVETDSGVADKNGETFSDLTESIHHYFNVTDHESPELVPKTRMPKIIYPQPAPDGLRRSRRVRVPRLNEHKMERIVYDYRRRSGMRIMAIQPSNEGKYLEHDEKLRKARKRRNQIKKAKLRRQKDGRNLSIHGVHPDDLNMTFGSDIPVVHPVTNQEVVMTCLSKQDGNAYTGPSGKPPKASDSYVMCQSLNQSSFTTGELNLRPHAEKPLQQVTSNTLILRIIYGKIAVTIHRKTSVLETGDVFFIPSGAVYKLKNLRNDEAKLFYVNTIKQEDSESERETTESDEGDISEQQTND